MYTATLYTDCSIYIYVNSTYRMWYSVQKSRYYYVCTTITTSDVFGDIKIDASSPLILYLYISQLIFPIIGSGLYLPVLRRGIFLKDTYEMPLEIYLMYRNCYPNELYTRVNIIKYTTVLHLGTIQQ